MKRACLLLVVPLVLAACATSYTNQGVAAMNSGDCAKAEPLLKQAYANGEGHSINNMGVFYENCERDVAKAIQFYTLSARGGNEYAQRNLARLGAPVPPADLVRRNTNTYDPAAAALALELLRKGQPQPMPQPARPTTNCTTTYSYGTAYTTCR